MLPAFTRRHPQWLLNPALHNRVEDLVKDGLDAAVRFMRQDDASLNGRVLAARRLVLAAPLAYVHAHGVLHDQPEVPSTMG